MSMSYKKRVGIACLVLALLGLGFFAILDLHKKTDTENTSNTFHWVPEESFFVDYEITDKNTVKFRYSICFENNSEYDSTISLSAKFHEKDLKGWLKNEDSFLGCDENNKPLYREIKTGEKVNVVFVFEGEYLGGAVNEKLSFPEEVFLMHSFSNN